MIVIGGGVSNSRGSDKGSGFTGWDYGVGEGHFCGGSLGGSGKGYDDLGGGGGGDGNGSSNSRNATVVIVV